MHARFCVLSLDADRLDAFNRTFCRLRERHGPGEREVHWKKLDRGHGLLNFALDCLGLLLKSKTARFNAIVVNTRMYRKWSNRGADREAAFYTTYTQILTHIAAKVGESTQVFIDDRSDAYPKHHEALETIGNRMLVNLQSAGRLRGVRKVSSKDHPGIQLGDLLTGAINTSHRLYLDQNTFTNDGKRLAIARLAEAVGWDSLHYDTWPHSRFNIWHFPETFRAVRRPGASTHGR